MVPSRPRSGEAARPTGPAGGWHTLAAGGSDTLGFMSRPHVAALVEDAWHGQLERYLRHRQWRNRIIAHIGYGSPNFVRVFARVVLTPDKDDDDQLDLTYGGMRSPYLTRRGWRSFVTAPAMHVPVTITAGTKVAHARTDRSGHVDLTFREHGLPPGWNEVTIWAEQSGPVTAQVFIVDPSVRRGIISDIDDTVISTSLPRILIAAWNTFVLNEGARNVVPGMAPLLRDVLATDPGAPIIYLSTGAWNTAPTLTRFLRAHAYPMGPLLLTDWGPTNTGWFRSGQEHKRRTLHRIARDFPHIQWLLVGDDGQHDIAIYSEFAEARPELVEALLIRQLSAAEQVLSHGLPVSTEELTGGRRAPSDVEMYQAPDGYGLLRLLRNAGKLTRPNPANPKSGPAAPAPAPSSSPVPSSPAPSAPSSAPPVRAADGAARPDEPTTDELLESTSG